MSKNLNEAESCPQCGQPMPAGTLAGFCPACLLAQGLETELDSMPKESPAFEPASLSEVAGWFPQLEIISLVGMGGMGAVYLAKQPALDRRVAVKILPRGGIDGVNFNQRFNREARALARLSHPNIVAVHEFGQVQGQPYFIMEFVDGVNLRQLAQAERLAPREVLRIIPQICDALQYAHDQGVVHRDIKPENVLVDRRGQVKIADFGLAKILERTPESARLTAEGQVMGTPHYMAPEQVERPLSVDHRADIYSLGVVFYEMLTGDLPIGKFPPPSRKVELDVRLDGVVLRALENDPERRYQQASEVKQRVTNITSNPASASGATSSEEEGLPGVRQLRWLGIPVVVERDGEREVSFNGALRALAVVLGAVTVAFFVVQWVTRSGHASPILGVWSGLLMLAWIIRRRLRGLPATEPPKRTAQGTVIVAPKRRAWLSSDAWPLLLLIVFVIGMHFFFRHVAGPWIRAMQRSAQAESRATWQRDLGTMKASIAGHGAVELLAVAHRGATPKQWWRPDGRLETETSYELRNPVESSMTRCVSKDMVFRLSGFGDGVYGPTFETEPAAAIGSGGEVYQSGQRVPGLLQARIAWPEGTSHGLVRAGFAVDSWRVVFRQDARGQNSRFEVLPDDPRWEFLVHGTSENAEGAQITMVMGQERRDWQSRIVAVDTNDVVHTHQRSAGTPKGDSTTWTYGFRGLSLAEVKEFRVEVRRVRWVEFRHIALEPDHPVPPPEPLRFGKTMELTFAELIDFDTGRLGEFSSRSDSSPKPGDGFGLAGVGDDISWAQEQGFDAVAGLGELQILQVNFAVVDNEDWDAPEPQRLMDKYYQGTFRPSTLGPLQDGKLPVTYSFETREGTLGLIQLVAFDPQRPGATVRIKHLIR